MTVAQYEILPATRAWTSDVEALACAMLDGVSDRERAERAALSLLFRDDEQTFAHAAFGEYLWSGTFQGRRYVEVRWAYLASALNAHRLIVDPSTRALLLIACSLAYGVHVGIGELVELLGVPGREGVVDAIAYACGVTR